MRKYINFMKANREAVASCLYAVLGVVIVIIMMILIFLKAIIAE